MAIQAVKEVKMRVVLSLLVFSAALLFSSAAFASDITPPAYCVSEALEPGPGFYVGFLERFTRFEAMGWISFTPIYAFHSEVSPTPGSGPGIYLGLSEATLSARLSLSGEDKSTDVMVHKKEGAGTPFSFFVTPAFREAFDHVRRAIGMPVIDNADSELNRDYGMRCGITWRFR